ncbi:MAG: transposase [Desulfonatronovibrionaceae bacterium]
MRMDLTSYEEKIKSEISAKKFLLKLCWKNHQRFCPRCLTRKLYRLATGKRRCSRCGYTFHDFSGRFLNLARLSPRQWLRFIKLFELDTKPEIMTRQMLLSHNSIRKLLTISRLSILSGSLDGPGIIRDLNMLELLKNSSTSRSISPVLGILPMNGSIFIDCIPDLGLDSLVHFHRSFGLRTKKMGRIVYTDPYKKYLSLTAWDDGTFHKSRFNPADDQTVLDTDRNFWEFARTRLTDFKARDPLRFLLFMKELEFRHNCTDKDLFTSLARHLCLFVPVLE